MLTRYINSFCDPNLLVTLLLHWKTWVKDN